MRKRIELTPIEFPQLKAFIHYFVEQDRNKAAKFIKEKYHTEHDCSGDGATLVRRNSDPVVWLRHKKPSTVSHEMIHAVLQIFDNIGIKRSYDTDELLCYYVGYCVEKICQ